MSDTPRTDAAIIERRHIHKICGCLELLELVDADVARKLERECNQLRAALGFVWAECCAALDRGEDPREMFVGAIVERVLQFLQAATDHNN